MPRLSHFGVLFFGIALCLVGVLSLLYRPARETPSTPALNHDAPPRELTAADLPSNVAAVKELGEKLVRDFKCNYCHRTDITARPEHPRANCQYCHQNARPLIPDHLAPPLEHIAARRPGAWLRRYLRYPYPIRIHESSRMPDLGLSDFEVEVAARYLESLAQVSLHPLNLSGPAREAAPDAARMEQAEALVKRFTCRVCHQVGESKPDFLENPAVLTTNPQAIFAPDLGQTFNRVRPGWLAPAIKQPSHWMPWSGMPDNAAMTDAEAELLAWWVMNCVPSPRPTVSFAEQVKPILFMRCTSCHYGPQPNPPMSANPEGGAGWLNTWTKKPRRLSFHGDTSVEVYENMMKGSLDDLGRRRAVVIPYAVNSPLLMHLNGGKHPVMPYGKNPLPQEEYRIIESWILSGARGPRLQSGVEVAPPIEFESR